MDKKLTDVFSNLSDEEIVEISDIDLECTIDEFTIKRIQAASLRKAGLKNEVSITENSIKKPIAWKRFAAVAAGFIMVLTILGTTGSAQYMAHLWTSRVNIGDGSKEIILNQEVGLIHIKEDAPKKELDGISIKQAEDILGIDLLDSAMYSNDLNYMPLIPDKEIERVGLWYPACVVYGSDENDKNISGSFLFLTDKATESVMSNEGIDPIGGKVLLRTYKSSNLNTTVILYGVDWSKARITAVFDYKNVDYSFIGNNVSETEMIEFIESLK
jgi:hypothetical protein